MCVVLLLGWMSTERSRRHWLGRCVCYYGLSMTFWSMCAISRRISSSTSSSASRASSSSASRASSSSSGRACAATRSSSTPPYSTSGSTTGSTMGSAARTGRCSRFNLASVQIISLLQGLYSWVTRALSPQPQRAVHCIRVR